MTQDKGRQACDTRTFTYEVTRHARRTRRANRRCAALSRSVQRAKAMLEVCFCIAQPKEETDATTNQHQHRSDPRNTDIESAGLCCYGWPHIRVQNFRHLACEEEANAWQHE